MAHFAQLDNNNQVLQVIVVDNNELLDEQGLEQETKGQAFCHNLLGGVWIQTSYNVSFRKHYAGPGFWYDSSRDAFVPPKPFESWVLDEDTCNWQSPVAYPSDGKVYEWNESTVSWVEVAQD